MNTQIFNSEDYFKNLSKKQNRLKSGEGIIIKNDTVSVDTSVISTQESSIKVIKKNGITINPDNNVVNITFRSDELSDGSDLIKKRSNISELNNNMHYVTLAELNFDPNEISTLLNLLTDEIVIMKPKVTQLQEDLTTEADAREAEDTNLRNQITTEADAREDADRGLQNQIDTINESRRVFDIQKGSEFYNSNDTIHYQPAETITNNDIVIVLEKNENTYGDSNDSFNYTTHSILSETYNENDTSNQRKGFTQSTIVGNLLDEGILNNVLKVSGDAGDKVFKIDEATSSNQADLKDSNTHIPTSECVHQAVSSLQSSIDGKQDKLTAGAGISISHNVISSFAAKSYDEGVAVTPGLKNLFLSKAESKLYGTQGGGTVEGKVKIDYYSPKVKDAITYEKISADRTGQRLSTENIYIDLDNVGENYVNLPLNKGDLLNYLPTSRPTLSLDSNHQNEFVVRFLEKNNNYESNASCHETKRDLNFKITDAASAQYYDGGNPTIQRPLPNGLLPRDRKILTVALDNGDTITGTWANIAHAACIVPGDGQPVLLTKEIFDVVKKYNILYTENFQPVSPEDEFDSNEIYQARSVHDLFLQVKTTDLQNVPNPYSSGFLSQYHEGFFCIEEHSWGINEVQEKALLCINKNDTWGRMLYCELEHSPLFYLKENNETLDWATECFIPYYKLYSVTSGEETYYKTSNLKLTNPLISALRSATCDGVSFVEEGNNCFFKSVNNLSLEQQNSVTITITTNTELTNDKLWQFITDDAGETVTLHLSDFLYYLETYLSYDQEALISDQENFIKAYLTKSLYTEGSTGDIIKLNSDNFICLNILLTQNSADNYLFNKEEKSLDQEFFGVPLGKILENYPGFGGVTPLDPNTVSLNVLQNLDSSSSSADVIAPRSLKTLLSLSDYFYGEGVYGIVEISNVIDYFNFKPITDTVFHSVYITKYYMSLTDKLDFLTYPSDDYLLPCSFGVDYVNSTITPLNSEDYGEGAYEIMLNGWPHTLKVPSGTPEEEVYPRYVECVFVENSKESDIFIGINKITPVESNIGSLVNYNYKNRDEYIALNNFIPKECWDPIWQGEMYKTYSPRNNVLQLDDSAFQEIVWPNLNYSSHAIEFIPFYNGNAPFFIDCFDTSGKLEYTYNLPIIPLLPTTTETKQNDAGGTSVILYKLSGGGYTQTEEWPTSYEESKNYFIKTEEQSGYRPLYSSSQNVSIFQQFYEEKMNLKLVDDSKPWQRAKNFLASPSLLQQEIFNNEIEESLKTPLIKAYGIDTKTIKASNVILGDENATLHKVVKGGIVPSEFKTSFSMFNPSANSISGVKKICDYKKGQDSVFVEISDPMELIDGKYCINGEEFKLNKAYPTKTVVEVPIIPCVAVMKNGLNAKNYSLYRAHWNDQDHTLPIYCQSFVCWWNIPHTSYVVDTYFSESLNYVESNSNILDPNTYPYIDKLEPGDKIAIYTNTNFDSWDYDSNYYKVFTCEERTENNVVVNVLVLDTNYFDTVGESTYSVTCGQQAYYDNESSTFNGKINTYSAIFERADVDEGDIAEFYDKIGDEYIQSSYHGISLPTTDSVDKYYYKSRNLEKIYYQPFEIFKGDEYTANVANAKWYVWDATNKSIREAIEIDFEIKTDDKAHFKRGVEYYLKTYQNLEKINGVTAYEHVDNYNVRDIDNFIVNSVADLKFNTPYIWMDCSRDNESASKLYATISESEIPSFSFISNNVDNSNKIPSLKIELESNVNNALKPVLSINDKLLWFDQIEAVSNSHHSALIPGTYVNAETSGMNYHKVWLGTLSAPFERIWSKKGNVDEIVTQKVIFGNMTRPGSGNDSDSEVDSGQSVSLEFDNDNNDLIINKRPKIATGNTRSEVAVKSDIPTNYVTTDTVQTISGIKTFDKPANVSGQEIATLKVKTAQGGAIILGKEAANSGTMLRLDQSDGTCRLRLRTSSVAGAVVWEQPENNSKLFMDFKNNSGGAYRIEYPQKAGTLALKSDIPNIYVDSNGFLHIDL